MSTAALAIGIAVYRPDLDVLARTLAKLTLADCVGAIFLYRNSQCDALPTHPKLRFLGNEVNIGIAGAQNVCAAAASDAGCDFILFLDQDSTLDPEGMVALMASFHRLEAQGLRPGIVGPLDVDETTLEPYHKRLQGAEPIADGIHLVSHTLSSGSLCRVQDFLSLGGNREDLFIDLVDTELCYRFASLDKRVFVNRNVTLLHNLGHGARTFMGLRIGIPAAVRNYYQTRNPFLLLTASSIPLTFRIKLICNSLIKAVYFCVFDSDRRQRAPYVVRGLLDGILMRGGSYEAVWSKNG